METRDFAEISEEFNQRVEKMIWCNFANVENGVRPRSRIVHPVWEGKIGWVTSRRNSYKAKDIEANPNVSLAYCADVAKPVYVECVARWVDDLAEKARVWEFLKAVPAPMGFDPATIFKSIHDPNYGLLKLEPYRIELSNFPEPSLIWRG